MSDEAWKEYRQTGSKEAKETLIMQYAPLVKYVVNRLTILPSPCAGYEDFVGYGILGLIKAIEKFDETKGLKFESYALRCIRWTILDELRVLDWVPRSLRKRARDLKDTYLVLEHRLGRSASDEEVAQALGLTAEELDASLTSLGQGAMLSLDEQFQLGDDEGAAIMDFVRDPANPAPEAWVEARELRAALASAIDELPERERLVVSLYYHEELTVKEIARVLSVSESRVSQLHSKAILRLRATLEREGLLTGVHHAERRATNAL